MDYLKQITMLFIYAIPVACIAWTFTHEEIFREIHEFVVRKSKHGKNIFVRKFFFLFACEYCLSHYLVIFMLVITNYTLIFPDWRGYFIGGFSMVWIANVYMTLFQFIRMNIKKDKTEIELEEEQLGKR